MTEQIINLPEHCQDLIGKDTWGPNCYNATLFFHEATDTLEGVEYKDMTNWICECTQSIDEKQLEHGDILTMISDSILEHTAVYLGNNLYFHKSGIGGTWEITSKKRIEKLYPDMKIIFCRIE